MSETGAPGAAVGGRPLWQALAALVVPPVLVAASLGGASLVAAASAAERATTAQHEVEAVAHLDALRRAVDAELLPTLLVVALEDEELSRRLGFGREAREALHGSQTDRLASLRAASDAALGALADFPGAGVDVSTTANDAANRLVAARAAADGSTPDPAALAESYQRTTDVLARAQGRAVARALSTGPSTRAALALQDLQVVVRLGQLGSRQLPLLLASRVTDGDDAAADERAWLTAWGAYTDLVGDSTAEDLTTRWDALATPSLQARWGSALDEPVVVSLGGLLDAQALDPTEPVLPSTAVPSAAIASASRDRVVAELLTAAVEVVAEATAQDARAAAERTRALLAVVAAVLALVLGAALVVGRWLSRSSADLAAAAHRVSQGELVDVPEGGPRELRTASRALTAAVTALRRVQEQARLVVAGRHEEALGLRALPGPLGRDVHAWTLQVARSAQAREQLQDQVAHQGAHDGLTGLATRARVLAELEAVLRADLAAGRRTGLMFIDLDGFKAVNDAHGHAAGDALLVVVADRLRGAVRPGDLVGRLGGDEFVVVVPDAPRAETLVRRATALVRAVSEPVRLPEGEGLPSGARVVVGASVGVATSEPSPAGAGTSGTSGASGGSGARTLLAEADTAAYRAKAAGRGRVELFGQELRHELAERAETERALRTALALGQLRVVYQPVVATGAGAGAAGGAPAGAVLGVEALLRWERPGHGPVSTAEVIAVAERTSLVRDLGRHVLAEATLQLVRWRVRGLAVPEVCVNLSGRHLADPRVITDVVEALETSGLEPHHLLLEITETVLVDDARAVQHLRALRAHGVRVAIDDFGTGFTSIGALATTPADRIKVARALVIADDPARQQLLALTARAGSAFGLEVVALGVETAEQRDRAAGAGCTGVQGWLVGGAVPAEQVPALLASAPAAVPVPAHERRRRAGG